MQDPEYLCSFHIDNKDRFNQQDKKQVKKDALFLFANLEAKNEHNISALKEINTQDNPVAVIKAQTISHKTNLKVRAIDHYDNDRTPAIINLPEMHKCSLLVSIFVLDGGYIVEQEEKC